MGAADVIGLTEGLLSNLPVGMDDLGDVRLLEAFLEIPRLKLVDEFAQEVLQ